MSEPDEPRGSEVDTALLSRYLADECSPREQLAVRDWLAASPENGVELARWHALWDRAGRVVRAEVAFPGDAASDAASAWHRLRQTAGALDDRQPSGVGRSSGKSYPWSRGVGGASAWRVTAMASVLVALGIGLALGGGQHRAGSSAAAGREYATAAGQRLSVTLVDGTQLTLAPASHVQLAADYGAHTRELSLNGEAVFTVMHDGTRPFRVRAQKVVTEDVGTRFGVRAYGSESGVRVVVADGAVALADTGHRPRLAAGAQPTQLSAGDVAVVDTAGHVGIMRHVELEPYFAWTEGRLVFENTPLPDVANALARWYGVRVEIGDATLQRRHLTLTLTPQALGAALGIIAPVAGARAERRGNTYVLLTNTELGHP